MKLNKLLILSILLFVVKSTFAQVENKQGIFVKVTYKPNVYKGLEDPNAIQSSMDRKMDADMNYAFEKIEFVLYASKNKSLYKIIDKIDPRDNDIDFKIEKIGLGGNEVFYIDNENKEHFNNTEFSDEKFIITLPLNKYNWKISSESKLINGYTCFKASAHFEDYQKFRNKTISFDPVVWFAPKLPYPFGPSDIYGLPGLILEGSINGKTYFYASKIEFNDDFSTFIEKPKKGKVVTPEEYENIQIGVINEHSKPKSKSKK